MTVRGRSRREAPAGTDPQVVPERAAHSWYASRAAPGHVVETPAYHSWERALLMGCYVAAALGTAVLEPALAGDGAAILGRLAAVAFPMAASVALVMEAVGLAGLYPPALMVVVVLLLFGAGHSSARQSWRADWRRPGWDGRRPEPTVRICGIGCAHAPSRTPMIAS